MGKTLDPGARRGTRSWPCLLHRGQRRKQSWVRWPWKVRNCANRHAKSTFIRGRETASHACFMKAVSSPRKGPGSLQFSLVAQSCPTLCDPTDCSMPGLPVHHQLPEFTQTCVHRLGDAIQPSHPLSPPSPPAFNLSQHQGLLQWVSSSHPGAKVLEF